MACVYTYSRNFRRQRWLYVGSTSRPPELREYEHWRSSYWYGEHDKYLCWPVEEHLKCAVEALLVADLHPEHNRLRLRSVRQPREVWDEARALVETIHQRIKQLLQWDAEDELLSSWNEGATEQENIDLWRWAGDVPAENRDRALAWVDNLILERQQEEVEESFRWGRALAWVDDLSQERDQEQLEEFFREIAEMEDLRTQRQEAILEALAARFPDLEPEFLAFPTEWLDGEDFDPAWVDALFEDLEI